MKHSLIIQTSAFNACHCPHSPTPVCVLLDLCRLAANQDWTTATIGIATTNETNPQICVLDHPPKWQSSDHWSCNWFQARHWRNSLWFYIFSSGTHYMWRWCVSSDFSKLADGGWMFTIHSERDAVKQCLWLHSYSNCILLGGRCCLTVMTVLQRAWTGYVHIQIVCKDYDVKSVGIVMMRWNSQIITER